MPRFLDGCQLVAVSSVTVQREAFTAAQRPGVMRAIKGNIGAAAAKRWDAGEKIAIKARVGSKSRRSSYK
jgi:hypothetical protein